LDVKAIKSPGLQIILHGRRSAVALGDAFLVPHIIIVHINAVILIAFLDAVPVPVSIEKNRRESPVTVWIP
jgi:hypothetical protein